MLNPAETQLLEKAQEYLGRFSLDFPAVIVPVYNALTEVMACLDSLKEASDSAYPVLVLDDASPDPQLAPTLELLCEELGFAYLRKATNSGFVGTVNLGFAAAVPRDVIVLNSDIVLPKHWLERLRAAAYSRSNVATATPLTNYGGIISVPYRNTPTPDLTTINGLSLTETDNLISKNSLKLCPFIPTAVGHCVYFRRNALDALGNFDETFAPGYGEEVDFSQRAILAGFAHVLADDLYIYHKGSASFGENPAKRKIQSEHEEITKQRYPWYSLAVQEAMGSNDSPLALALELVRGTLLGYDIAIDATCLSGETSGTQVLTLELIRALATTPNRKDKLTVIIEDKLPRAKMLGVDKLVDEVLTVSSLRATPRHFDLVHRPFQLYWPDDLTFLLGIAKRFAFTQLDSIAYANPAYAASPEAWQQIRRLTELAFAIADGVAFTTHTAMQEAINQGLGIEVSRRRVTSQGVDHQLHRATPTAPPIASELAQSPFLLVLGADFQHKNRLFCLKLLAALVEEYNWPGQLVFAGPHRAQGGSAAQEAAYLKDKPELAARFHDLGTVDEGEKSWLLQKAALILYPSNIEGFGMIPFEAAEVGTPALTTQAASLPEVLGEAVLFLKSLDPLQGAATVWELLSNPELAAHQLLTVKARAKMFSWENATTETWAFYHQILSLPPRSQTVAHLQSEIRNLQEQYHKLETWANGLNERLTDLEAKPGFKALSRLKLI